MCHASTDLLLESCSLAASCCLQSLQSPCMSSQRNQAMSAETAWQSSMSPLQMARWVLQHNSQTCSPKRRSARAAESELRSLLHSAHLSVSPSCSGFCILQHDPDATRVACSAPCHVKGIHLRLPPSRLCMHQVLASEAEEERMQAAQLAAGTPLYLEPGTTYTLMPRLWLQLWRAYVNGASKRSRPQGAALPPLPPSLTEACQALFCGCHSGDDARLAYQLPDLAHRYDSTVNASQHCTAQLHSECTAEELRSHSTTCQSGSASMQ